LLKCAFAEMLALMPTLFVVATPIGNLDDISPRAVRVLGAVALVAAEDTRVARMLLNHYKIKARLLSYNEHNRGRRIPEILAALAEGDVALVSDAGTPAISDPGVELVAATREAGFRVEAVPGPSAVVAALSVAGLWAGQWRFAGFLPRSQGDLRRLLQAVTGSSETLVAYDAPSRLRRTLQIIAEVLPDRRLAICRELTKVHEEVFVGTAAEALAHFSEVRGEIVVVIEGEENQADGSHPSQGSAAELGAEDDIRLMQAAELTQAQAAVLITARYNLTRRQVYKLWLTALSEEPKPSPRR
jgi:16S rRNA (cytidine1402-2'-O)-methyltransferase